MILETLRGRWQASYDLQLTSRRGRLYLQVMWAYLEQQSFPLDAEQYTAKLDELVATLNGLGVAGQVRQWLTTTNDKPRQETGLCDTVLGRARKRVMGFEPTTFTLATGFHPAQTGFLASPRPMSLCVCCE